MADSSKLVGINVYYVYGSELYCVDCTDPILAELDRVGSKNTGDTNDYPQSVQSGEADRPHHCDDCSDFLENPLTKDGYDYVRKTIVKDWVAGNRKSVAITLWKDFYGIEFQCDYCGDDIDPDETVCDDCAKVVNNPICAILATMVESMLNGDYDAGKDCAEKLQSYIKKNYRHPVRVDLEERGDLTEYILTIFLPTP